MALKSMNYIVIKCDTCHEVIKVQPGVAFDEITHTCKNIKTIETEEKPKRTRKPKAD